MVWQHVYGEMWDANTNNTKYTSSRRGVNKYIAGRIRTSGSGGFSWESEHEQGKDVVPRPDFRRVKKKDREQAKKTYEEMVNQKTRYEHHLTLSFGADQHFYINGVEITAEKLKQLEATNDETKQ